MRGVRPRAGPGRLDGLGWLAVGAAALAAFAVVWILLTSGALGLYEGCGYIDGTQYCAMALGKYGMSPWNRRILVPDLVRLIGHGPIVGRFRVISLLSTLGSGVAAGVLGGKVARSLRARPARRQSAAVLVGALVLLMPHTVHLAYYLTVLTDYPATCLGLWWFVCATGRRTDVRWIGVVLAAATVLAREAWAPSILLFALLLMTRPGRRDRILAVATVAAVAGALAVVLQQPSVGTEPSSLAAAEHWLHDHFTSLEGLGALAWAVLLPLGALPLLALQLPRASAGMLRTALRRHDPLLVGILLVSAGHLLMALVGGSDVMRLVAVAAPFLAALGVGVVAAGPARLDARSALLVAATVILWRPLQILHGPGDEFLALFAPQDVPGAVRAEVLADAVLVAPVLGLWAMLAAGSIRAGRRLRRGAAAVAVPELRS